MINAYESSAFLDKFDLALSILEHGAQDMRSSECQAISDIRMLRRQLIRNGGIRVASDYQKKEAGL